MKYYFSFVLFIGIICSTNIFPQSNGVKDSTVSKSVTIVIPTENIEEMARFFNDFMTKATKAIKILEIDKTAQKLDTLVTKIFNDINSPESKAEIEKIKKIIFVDTVISNKE